MFVLMSRYLNSLPILQDFRSTVDTNPENELLHISACLYQSPPRETWLAWPSIFPYSGRLDPIPNPCDRQIHEQYDDYRSRDNCGNILQYCVAIKPSSYYESRRPPLDISQSSDHDQNFSPHRLPWLQQKLFYISNIQWPHQMLLFQQSYVVPLCE